MSQGDGASRAGLDQLPLNSRAGLDPVSVSVDAVQGGDSVSFSWA